MIGMTLLSISTFLALLQTVLPNFKWTRNKTKGAKFIESITAGSAFLIASAFFSLIYAFFSSNLSYLNVALNSHRASDILYKISGVWGNHEGSMLLWLVLLTSLSTLFAIQKTVPRGMRLGALQILGSISLCFHLFILLISNPFVQLHQTPQQGIGLNPLLEDPSLAVHPPILYTGLALLSVIFALACVGLKAQRLDQSWARIMRPWALSCWCFLTLGITLGSWWAYYELGWGGWWFWDPVENLSLLPWLVMTGLLHSLIAVDKSSRQQFTAAFLAIMGFLLALLSLFLVRSGALSSVHAFAVDPLRGGFLGLILALFTLYGIRTLLRFRRTESQQLPHILSREAFLFLNAALFLSIAIVVFIGTVYPLILNQLNGHMISVGAPYFTATTLPFFLVIMTLMAAIPFVGWQGSQLKKQISYMATFALASLVFISYWKQGWPVMATLFLAASLCVLLATIIDFFHKRHHISLGYISMALAHASIAIVIMGAVTDSFEKVETIQVMKKNDSVSFQGFHLTLNNIDEVRAPYFQRQIAFLGVQNDSHLFTLKPEKRYYPLHEMITSETDIHRVGMGDLYAVLGSSEDSQKWIVKLTWHPAIRLLWIGAGLMVLAGFLGFLAALRRLQKS
jgi:cytochrome c-type biogenesis protein CcmF